MPEKIFLTYTNATSVPYQGSVLGHHVVLNYIDANGDHHTLQGVPEHKFEHNLDKLGASVREEILSDGANNTDSRFQRLIVKPELLDSDGSLNQPRTMVAEGDDLSSRWALMRDFGNEVNSIGYDIAQDPRTVIRLLAVPCNEQASLDRGTNFRSDLTVSLRMTLRGHFKTLAPSGKSPAY